LVAEPLAAEPDPSTKNASRAPPKRSNAVEASNPIKAGIVSKNTMPVPAKRQSN
jgi:hypothetical protein